MTLSLTQYPRAATSIIEYVSRTINRLGSARLDVEQLMSTIFVRIFHILARSFPDYSQFPTSPLILKIVPQ